MIEQLDVYDFKCLRRAELQLGKLTLVTGRNSSGKSSVIQALQYFADHYRHWPAAGSQSDDGLLLPSRWSFGNIRNIYTNASHFDVKVTLDGGHRFCVMSYAADAQRNRTRVLFDEQEPHLAERPPLHVCHLSATRRSSDERYGMGSTPDNPFDEEGQFVADYFFTHRYDGVAEHLIFKPQWPHTLEGQVNGWLAELAGYRMQVVQQGDSYQLQFIDEIGNAISAAHVGTGVGFLAALIVVCLAAGSGSVVAIENPEIHLHPRAQADLTAFLARVAAAGRQILVETHSDHIVNGVLVSIKLRSVPLARGDVRIYFFEEDRDTDDAGRLLGEHCMKPVELSVTANGRIYDPPAGFFDQIDIDQITLLRPEQP